jgi:hypothetical protein
VVAELVAADLDGRHGVRSGSGAEGTRTPGLRAASATLFQLSYSPSEVEIRRNVNARPLAVARGIKPQPDGATANDAFGLQTVATAEPPE